MKRALDFLHGARKAGAAAVAAALPVLVEGAQDGIVTPSEWWAVAGAAVLAGVAVYWTPNRQAVTLAVAPETPGGPSAWVAPRQRGKGPSHL